MDIKNDEGWLDWDKVKAEVHKVVDLVMLNSPATTEQRLIALLEVVTHQARVDTGKIWERANDGD